MNFGIKRLPATGNGRRYHLYDKEEQLLLVADHGSPWLPKDPCKHVRFAKPDGRPVASLDLPWQENGRKKHKHTSYAIIYDFAVYAIINEYGRSLDGDPLSLPYYLMEVEGVRWLVCGGCEQDLFLGFYDDVPDGLAVFTEPQDATLPEPIGRVQSAQTIHDFQIKLPVDSFSQASLLSLALIFLVDRYTC